MKLEQLKVITRTWYVAGTVPDLNPKFPNYVENFSLGVEAESMEKALEAARKVYPTATFITCNHRGEINLRA